MDLAERGMIAVRSLVMVSVLVAVPLLALAPGIVGWMFAAGDSVTETDESAGQSQRQQGPADDTRPAESTGRGGEESAEAVAQQGVAVSFDDPLPTGAPRRDAGGSRSAAAVSNAGDLSNTGELYGTGGRATSGRAGGVMEARRPTASAASRSVADASDPRSERVTQIQRQLQRLGAVSYRLETWDGTQPVFRFHCVMETGSGSPQAFQATSENALGAMERVLRDVHSWRQARHDDGRMLR